MTRRFAENTSVSVEKSKAEIEGLVMRNGGTAFVSGWAENRALIQFAMNGRQIKFILELPERGGKQFRLTPHQQKVRSAAAQHEAWEQACRSRWRALLLAIKAKLEAVAVGISVFDQEFLSFIVDPTTGRTLGEQLIPQVEQVYKLGGTKPIGLLGFSGDPS